jgi:spore coat polysaccharide biosynthesis predicted glycosyltransferase SpsG
MGHFYRALNLAAELKKARITFRLYLNEHLPSQRILTAYEIPYSVVNLGDISNNWETRLIRRDGISLWINDRLDTEISHAQKIKSAGIPLVTFDDRGSGAMLADLHIAALSFSTNESLGGLRLLRGIDYLILNPQIDVYKRKRSRPKSILVTLGGSDTYGVTVKVVKLLKEMGLAATVVVGPSFMHMESLHRELTKDFILKSGVPSLVAEFYFHDLAITNGGITPFEANASGLPCIVIANEKFEIPAAEALQTLGGVIFVGHHEALKIPLFNTNLPLTKMSMAGLKSIDLLGVERVVAALQELVA